MRRPLGSLQLEVMRTLWAKGRATVAEVQQALAPTRPLAYTTLATVLGRLERQGIVERRDEGRAAVYEPAVSESDVGHSVVTDLLERLFSGRPSELVSHLLDSQPIDAAELARIKNLVAKHETKRRPTRKKRGGGNG